MARVFQFGTDGIETMLTDEGSILNTQSALGEVTIIEENVATIVENPDFEPNQKPSTEVVNAPTPDVFG